MLTVREACRDLMPFRQQLMADPATMAYNAPWFPPDGCIPFPESQWNAFLSRASGQEPAQWCGFLVDEAGAPVGEISWHDFGKGIGIVIASSQRGKGYGLAGLRLLVERAFSHSEITELCNDFESQRGAALAIHKAAGFVPVGMKNGILHLRLTRERYEALHRRHLLSLLTDAMCAFDAGDAPRIHHFIKVHGFARQIGLASGLDEGALFTLEAAAITHDTGIHPSEARYGDCTGPHQEELGPIEAEPMLRALGFPPPVVARVCFLIAHHHTTANVAGIDWQILLEADFLVNMVEGNASLAAIRQAEEKLFHTPEGKKLLRCLVP